jgi:hypothetical protein
MAFTHTKKVDIGSFKKVRIRIRSQMSGSGSGSGSGSDQKGPNPDPATPIQGTDIFFLPKPLPVPVSKATNLAKDWHKLLDPPH